jgi:hypothetical protein
MKTLLSKGNTNAKTKKNKRESLILYLKPGQCNGATCVRRQVMDAYQHV